MLVGEDEFITNDKLREFWGDKPLDAYPQTWAEFLEEFDEDGIGKIDKEAFKKGMLK